ncbi:cell adhesion molecule Dscam1-like [Haliotis asinina]|uniref:cell adhesion molecule Dscam1-like n=1 Tax=Haliotis asinina TaxID=109174 RepID=UPI003532212C
MLLHILILLSSHFSDAYNLFIRAGEELGDDIVIPSSTVIYALSPSNEFLCTITKDQTITMKNKLGFSCNNSSMEGRVHFSIRSVEQQDAGTYRWTKGSANKPLGSIFTLFVTDAPTTPRVVAEDIAVLNMPLTLKCLSNSSTVPGNHNLTMNYFWKRNGVTQNSSSTSTFKIQKFRWVKEQRFSCISMERTAMSDESPALLITAERGPSEIKLIPTETRFVKVTGESVRIRCKSRISCNPRCNTIWRKDGRVFPSRDLILSNLTSSDQGDYTCHMENKHGRADRHVHIVVEYGPKSAVIQHEENTKETTLGSPVTLACNADCRPPCQFAWSVKTTHIDSRQTLHIPDVQRNKTGNYTCRAWNKHGEATATFQLIVKYPAEISVTASNTVPLPGSNIGLTCNVDSFPAPQITWLRGNTNLSSRRFSVSEAAVQVDSPSNSPMHNYSFRYVIGNAKCLGKVTYTCAVTNGVGSKRSKNIDIDFRCAPFVEETAGVEAIFYRPTDKSDKIHFNVTANPKPSLIWSRAPVNGNSEPSTSRRVKDLSLISGSSYQLELVHLDVHRRDEGNYTVIISNPLGKYDINYRLIVQVPPSPPTNLTEVNVTETDVTLSWLPGFDGHADQHFQISWTRGARDETTETSSTSVTLTGLDVDETYSIRVRGVNIAGKGNYSEEINVATLKKAGRGYNVRTVFTVVLIGTALVFVVCVLLGLTYCIICGPCRKKRPLRSTKATYSVTKNDTNDTEEEQADLWEAVATEQNMLVSTHDAEKSPQDPRSLFVETLTYTRLSESEAQRESLSCTTFTDEGQRRSFMCTAFNDVNRRGSLILTTYNDRHGCSRFPAADQQTALKFPYPPLTNGDIQEDCFPYPTVEYEGASYPPMVNEEVVYEGFAYPPLTYGGEDTGDQTPYVIDATLPGRSHNTPVLVDQCGNYDSFSSEEHGGNIYMNM